MARINFFLLVFCLSITAFAYAEVTQIPIYMEDQLGISVTQDQSQFHIKLKSNPSTGFSWFLRSYDASLLKPEKRTIIPAKSSLLGAAGYELWTFRVKPDAFIVPQQTLVRFIYSRPWDINDQGKIVVVRISTVTSSQN